VWGEEDRQGFQEDPPKACQPIRDGLLFTGYASILNLGTPNDA